jgi:hypothetical protein
MLKANLDAGEFVALALLYIVLYIYIYIVRQGVPKQGAESGVSGCTRVLPGTLVRALVMLHTTLFTGHDTFHDG